MCGEILNKLVIEITDQYHLNVGLTPCSEEWPITQSNQEYETVYCRAVIIKKALIFLKERAFD